MREGGCAGVDVITGAGAIVRSASVTVWAQQGASEFRSEGPLFESWPEYGLSWTSFFSF